MSLEKFLQQLKKSPENIEFSETMSIIESLYIFTETEFKNGDLLNKSGQNSGSCKLFAFAQLQNLSKEQTLACFGSYYRGDVVENPEANNHQNIRNFIKQGWSGIEFSKMPLQEKEAGKVLV